MSKIARATQKIFGVSAGPDEISQFGSLAAADPTFTIDPVVLQALSNYDDGWFAGVLLENSPAIEDMNSLFYLITYQLCYMFQAGISEWDSGTTYFINSLVTSGPFTYISIVDNNTNNLVTDNSKWALQNSKVTLKTGTGTIAATDQYVRATTSGSDYALTLPTIASSIGQLVEIKNCTNALNTVTVTGNGSETIDFATTLDLGAGQSCRLFNNGVNWDIR